MRTTWRVLGLNAVLAAALAASPALAADPEKTADKDKDLAEIKKLLDGINRSLGGLDRMEREIEDLRFDRDVRVRSMQAEVSDMKKQIARMREDLDRLLGPEGSRRTAFSPPNPGTSGPTGTIRLVNTYMVPVSVFINDQEYVVEPGQTRNVIGVPAGRFNYY